MVKRPYLFRPDYRAPGAQGHKRKYSALQQISKPHGTLFVDPLGDTETMVRRSIHTQLFRLYAHLTFSV